VCGIVGAFTMDSSRPSLSSQISRMRESIRHRGPDDSGEYHLPGVSLGHQRLSIVDLKLGRQPWIRNNLVVVFNGEIYNHDILRAELQEKGVLFRSRCDTEVLAAAYEVWGENAFSRFDGMFACAIFDEQRGELSLARDRFGIKPLYVADSIKGACVFASEIQGVRAFSPDLSADWSAHALENYLSLGYVLEPNTFHQGVRQLAPGTIERYRVGTMNKTVTQFFCLESAMQDREEITQEHGEKLLFNAVHRQRQADVSVGTFLSGGLDSGLLTSILSHQVPPESINSYSAGFDQSGFDEVPMAAELAGQLGVVHNSHYLNADLLQQADEVLDVYGTPFADNAAIPTYHLSSIAAKKTKVLLSGDGADELFFGYRNHRSLFVETAIKGMLPSWVKKPVLGWLANYYPNSPAIPRFLRAKSTLKALSMGLAEGYCAAMSATDRTLLESLYHADFKRELAGYRTENRFMDIASEVTFDDPMKTMQYLDFKTYLPGSVLKKVDRATMRAGVEARVPFLDNALSSAALSQKSCLNLGVGNHKTQLRKWSSPWLPEAARCRVKKSFTSPLDKWFRDLHYTRFCRLIMSEALMDSRIFNTDALQFFMDKHYRSEANYGTTLWAITVLSKAISKNKN
jgi:asparagine synthase (glutamine-hydrolysing)